MKKCCFTLLCCLFCERLLLDDYTIAKLSNNLNNNGELLDEKSTKYGNDNENVHIFFCRPIKNEYTNVQLLQMNILKLSLGMHLTKFAKERN